MSAEKHITPDPAIPSELFGDNKIAKLLLSVPEAAACLSVSRAHLYRLLQAGELRAVRSRGATRVPYSELVQYVARLMSEGR